jgi:flavin-binding protein dodecin
MNDTSTYKIVEIVGSSPAGITEAMQNGVTRAGKTLRNIGWVEVTEVRGHVADGKIAHFQVGMKVGFTLED